MAAHEAVVGGVTAPAVKGVVVAPPVTPSVVTGSIPPLVSPFSPPLWSSTHRTTSPSLQSVSHCVSPSSYVIRCAIEALSNPVTVPGKNKSFPDQKTSTRVPSALTINKRTCQSLVMWPE